jgi:predicted nucleic acid-binding protein
MNGKILLDTNILIELLSGNEQISSYIEGFEIYISAITSIELLSKPEATVSEIKVIKKMISECTVLEHLNPNIQEVAAKLRREKTVKKTPDAIIVATSIFHELPLLTFDIELKNLKDINLVIFED